MATITGTFSGVIGVPSSGFTLKIDYSYTQDITLNCSYVSATGYVKRNNSTYHPYNTSSYVTLNVGGNLTSPNPQYNINSDSWYQIASMSNVRINHNADGTGSVYLALSMDGRLSNWYPNGSISKTITLNTIPRASTLSLNPTSVTLGGSIAISISRAASSFTHTLQHDFVAGSWTTFASNAATSASLATSLDWASRIPAQTSGTGRIRCLTYNGSTLIGEKIYNFTAAVPESVVPSISSITATETASGINAKFSAFIQGKSIPQITITAAGAYGSTISTYTTTLESISYPGSTFTAGILNNSGTVTITSTVTDSRGRTASKPTTITVLPYSPPTISSFSIERCNSDGTLNPDGTYVKIILTGNIASCNSKNTNTYKVEYKPTSASTWTSLMSGSGYTINLSQAKTITGGFLTTSSYDFRLTLTDYFTTTSSERSIPTSFTILNWNASGKGIGIGKVSEKDKLEVAIPAEFSNSLTVKGKELSTLIIISPDEPGANEQTVGSIWLKEE